MVIWGTMTLIEEREDELARELSDIFDHEELEILKNAITFVFNENSTKITDERTYQNYLNLRNALRKTETVCAKGCDCHKRFLNDVSPSWREPTHAAHF